MLIRTNMEDLRDTTHSRHYEVYRKDRLKEVSKIQDFWRISTITDYEGPMKPFLSKYQIFWLGQTIWANKFWGIFDRFISTHFGTVWVPCPCFPLINHYFWKTKPLYPNPNIYLGLDYEFGMVSTIIFIIFGIASEIS